jgi:hypothetical protein
MGRRWHRTSRRIYILLWKGESEKEEHRQRVFENRVPKRDEVRGGWRKLHNKELHNLHTSPRKIGMIKSRRVRWAGHVTRM